MTGGRLESRIVKLESLRTRPDEMLVVWRHPDASVADALEGVAFAHGDKVICAEWFEDSPPPAPRWYRGRLSQGMTAVEYEQINRTIDRLAKGPEADRTRRGFSPFPSFTEARMKEMSDAELIHALLGVPT
ncbi:hypothetical protein ABIA06_004569 [Bradyrhizobium yuanmingense]|uniref:hypothetical protein n=1 Tax=Bradyrhizobium yuanmingense TaxID=108015 RepID=UPI0035171924